ncbi:MAG: hypothetical protein ACREOG_14245 [Gemmatimonadaceae bacterium]
MLGGCLKTIGCGTLLLVGAGVAWLTRDRWYPGVRDGRGVEQVEAPLDTLSDTGADRAAASLRSLERPSGPAYVNIAPADLASLLVREAGRRGPLPLKQARAGVVEDRLWLRGTLDLRQLRAQGALGPLGALLGDEEDVELRGTLDMIRPGLAQFRVETFKARDLSIPSAAIPRLLRQLQGDRRPAGVSADGIAFPVPPYIGDVRIANGRITLYKTVSSS